ncbi:hypothetical protein HNQ88_005031 [Aureibacter tunicatorum]|uniref:Uncharacterized protein n=1 Tax=Aureibacter tunicatorum TaxID=866807 RepID=A0AAE4BT89_9BACT|nr:hypothetical protein [Aureibacter tunicatorum]BDD07550.1 hypothetical protein AUTU_50330 [Aureibacter tunicatorum]
MTLGGVQGVDFIKSFFFLKMLPCSRYAFNFNHFPSTLDRDQYILMDILFQKYNSLKISELKTCRSPVIFQRLEVD